MPLYSVLNVISKYLLTYIMSVHLYGVSNTYLHLESTIPLLKLLLSIKNAL